MNIKALNNEFYRTKGITDQFLLTIKSTNSCSTLQQLNIENCRHMSHLGLASIGSYSNLHDLNLSG